MAPDLKPLGRHVEHDERSRAFAVQTETETGMTGPKLALFGLGCVIGGIGLAVLLGAIGAECVWKYCQQRR